MVKQVDKNMFARLSSCSPSAVSRFIALRYLQSKRKEVFVSIITVISILGVAISVLVLNMVLSIMTGFEAELQSKLVNSTPHVLIRSMRGEMADWSRVVDVASQDAEVLAAFPYTYNQGMLSHRGRTQGLILRGIADTAGSRNSLEPLLEHGSNIEALFAPQPIEVARPDGEYNEVVLPPIIVGHALLANFGLRRGDIVTLFSAQLSSTPHGLIPKLRRFVVVGSYKSGLHEIESGLAYIAIKDAQGFFGLGESVTGVHVSVKDVFRAGLVGDRIVEQMDFQGGGFFATDWTIPNKPLWDALRMEKRVYYIVLLLLILVASFSIVSTMVMIVMEKSRDVAIMKTIGASDRLVLKIFFYQGALIGLLGTVLGTLLGYLGCIGLRGYGFPLDEAVFSLDKVPVHLIPSNFVLVAISALCITMTAGIYPAWRAARIQPASVLRYE